MDHIGGDWETKCNGVMINRPNHALAHTLRVANYAPYVIESLFNNAKNDVEKNAYKNLQHDLTKLQIALLFAVVGRENDWGFSDNSAAYMKFRRNSAEAFKKYVKTLNPPLFTAQEIDVYHQALIDLGNPDKQDHITKVMTTCHQLDLPRCYFSDQWPDVAKKLKGNLGDDFDALLSYALHCLKNTGDRIMAQPTKEFKDISIYNEATFAKTSADPLECLQAISKALPPAHLKPEPNLQIVYDDFLNKAVEQAFNAFEQNQNGLESAFRDVRNVLSNYKPKLPLSDNLDGDNLDGFLQQSLQATELSAKRLLEEPDEGRGMFLYN